MPLKHTQPDFDFNTPFVWEDYFKDDGKDEEVPYYPDPAKHDRERNPTETPAGFQMPSMDDILGPTRPDVEAVEHETPDTPHAEGETHETPEPVEAEGETHEAPEGSQAESPDASSAPEPPQLDPHVPDEVAPVHPQVAREPLASAPGGYPFQNDPTEEPEDTEANPLAPSGPDNSPQVPDDVDQQPPEDQEAYLPPASQPEDYLVDHPHSDNLFDGPMSPGETRTFQAYWM